MEPEFCAAAGAEDFAAGVAAWTITGIGDCAGSRPASAKTAKMDKVVARILFAPSAGIDSRHSEIFRNRSKLRINLSLVLSDRGFLALHFLGDRQNLLFLLLACAGSFRCRGGYKQGQGKKGN